MPKHLL